jgi:4-hydroxybenzoate polyprenyltransferase
MVKFLKITAAFLRLIRLPNLIIIGITQYFIRWFILKPLLGISDFTVQLSPVQFFILVLSTVLIAAAGYIINDYFDRKADLINRPGRVIVGRLIKRRYAMLLHGILSFAGVFLGIWLAYRIGQLKLSIIFLFATGVLWFYSTVYKRQLLVGNLVVASLVGFVPLLVILFELPLLANRYKLYVLVAGTSFDYLIFWVGSYAGFAFMLTLIREIIKDIEDYEGDSVFGRQTVPIVWGTHTAKWIVAGLIVLTVIPILYLLAFHLADKISFVYIVFFLLVPMFMLAFGVLWASSKRQYTILSQMTKIIMFAGLMYCPLVNVLIH